MYILKNAFKSINRSLGRNILIGIIVFVIAASSCIALSIKSAANKADEQGKESLNITASISVDRQSLMNSADMNDRDAMRNLMSLVTELSLSEMQKYAQSENVMDFVYTLSTQTSKTENFKPYSTESDTDSTSENSSNPSQNNRPGGQTQQMPGGGMIRMMGAMGDFNITGYSSESAMTSFVNGSLKISGDDSKMFDTSAADYTCIISNELAAFNNLSVNDKISISNPNKDAETYELTVVGLYKNEQASGTSDTMMRMSNSMDPANQIYMSYATLEDLVKKSADSADKSTDSQTGEETTTALRTQTSGTYIFKNEEAFEGFKSDAKAMGLSENYAINSNDLSNYQKSLEPLQNLSRFATILFTVVLIVGSLILIVFNLFNVRERKYEVGVLTAIGMKKPKVLTQFVTEIFVVTFVSIIIGTSAGAVASVPIGSKLLESQIASIENEQTQTENNFGRTGGLPGGNERGGRPNVIMGGQVGGPISLFGQNIDVEYLNDINASTDLTVLGQLILLGFLLTVVSSFAAVTFVLRYEPLKILANRA